MNIWYHVFSPVCCIHVSTAHKYLCEYWNYLMLMIEFSGSNLCGSLNISYFLKAIFNSLQVIQVFLVYQSLNFLTLNLFDYVYSVYYTIEISQFRALTQFVLQRYRCYLLLLKYKNNFHHSKFYLFKNTINYENYYFI